VEVEYLAKKYKETDAIYKKSIAEQKKVVELLFDQVRGANVRGTQ
jgi:hypothetical protein